METKDILKKLRKHKGFNSAQEFCEAADISFNTYQNYESGKRIPTTDILVKLADFYGVTTDYLLGRESPASASFGFNVENMEDAFIEAYKQLDEDMRYKIFEFLQMVVDGVAPSDGKRGHLTCGELEDKQTEKQDGEKLA